MRFTHNESSVICASKNGWDETIRYWSLHNNSYLRYFKGHRKKVISLAMNPVNDTFLSASLDQTARLWDLRSNATQGLIRPVKGTPKVAFGNQGVIFACTTENMIKLFDSRKFDSGPFATFQVNSPSSSSFNWSSLFFSADGKYLLLSTDSTPIFLVDAFKGDLINVFNDRENNNQFPISASFTPDSNFVLSGSSNGNILAWKIENNSPSPSSPPLYPKPIATLKGHKEVVKQVLFNPTHFMLASACSSLALWLPN